LNGSITPQGLFGVWREVSAVPTPSTTTAVKKAPSTLPGRHCLAPGYAPRIPAPIWPSGTSLYRKTCDLIDKVAPGKASVLSLGETGVGKDSGAGLPVEEATGLKSDTGKSAMNEPSAFLTPDLEGAYMPRPAFSAWKKNVPTRYKVLRWKNDTGSVIDLPTEDRRHTVTVELAGGEATYGEGGQPLAAEIIRTANATGVIEGILQPRGAQVLHDIPGDHADVSIACNSIDAGSIGAWSAQVVWEMAWITHREARILRIDIRP
jgi:hypothetical protein